MTALAVQRAAPRVSIDRIKAAVAAEFKVPLLAMISDRRDRESVRPRQVAIALACDLTPCSLVVIGRVFGGRDHTTVIHARRKVAELRADDAEFDAACRRLEADLSLPDPTPEFQLAFLSGPLFDRDLSVPAPTLRELEAA